MFDITKEVNRLQQLQHDKVHGLPYKPKQYDIKVQQIDGTLFESIAEQEHTFMLRRFRNHSNDFGKRLSKRRGEYHRPGGGYSLHSIKGG